MEMDHRSKATFLSKLTVLLFLPFFFASCVTHEEHVMTLEEARNVAVKYHKHPVDKPPRALGKDILRILEMYKRMAESTGPCDTPREAPSEEWLQEHSGQPNMPRQRRGLFG